MSGAMCGADCARCPCREGCGGCRETGGRPFRRMCLVAACCRNRGQADCGQCGGRCDLKEPLIAEFNALGIADMPEVTGLTALAGSYINLSYPLPSGQSVKLLEDDKIYLGSQLEQKRGGRCYGLAADEDHLLVCAYGEGGSDPEIIVYRKREKRADSAGSPGP